MRGYLLISVAALSVGAWAGETSTLQEAWKESASTEPASTAPEGGQAADAAAVAQPGAEAAPQPEIETAPQPEIETAPMEAPREGPAAEAPAAEAPAEAAAPADATSSEPAEAAPEERVVDMKHQIVPANTLWDLADRFYHNPLKWPTIYEANKDTIKDPHWIYPGQVLVIPGFGTIEAVAPGSGAFEPSEEPESTRAPAAVAAAPAPPAPVAEPSYDADLPKDSGDKAMENLSNEFPVSLVGFSKPADEVVAGKGWKKDGEYEEEDDNATVPTLGDTIVYRASGKPPAAGEKLVVYRRAEERDEGQLLEKIAVVKVVSHDGKKVTALIVEATDGLEDGDWLKRFGP